MRSPSWPAWSHRESIIPLSGRSPQHAPDRRPRPAPNAMARRRKTGVPWQPPAACRAILAGMSTHSVRSRRAFIGLAAAGVAGAAVAAKVAASGGTAPARPARPAARRRSAGENSLAGDPDWRIRNFGAPDAMLGYAGQASVLPGQPITLYASTTARSFQVKAYRMGWYS